MTELQDTLVQAEALRARTSNKDGIPSLPQDIMSLQQRAASVAQAGGGGGMGDQALLKARTFLPFEQVDGMNRLAYALELKSAFQAAPRATTSTNRGVAGLGLGDEEERRGRLAPPPDMDLDAYFDFHYSQIVANALEEASDAAEACAHRAAMRWAEEDWAEATADLLRHQQQKGGGGKELLELALMHQEQPDAMAVASSWGLNSANALRLARGTSRLTDIQKRYALAVGPAVGDGSEAREEGLAQRLPWMQPPL
ncbi:hypothetical protein Naga_100582g2 [Nannochloropsis gaditana]|uniref:Uncharacterized protein n=1 Tax=Nannochloropsis gaditana TaxID=72520 RepID=W7T7Y8_9STRA|nr:hypothetical protein Naga_100582g2 [Nannochloropsis gaditana]